MCLYSVVVPVYNSEHTLQELYTRLEKVFRETIKEEFELILVDDGSRDRSFAVMQELRERSPCQDHPDGKEFRTASCASVRICPCKGRVHRNYG